MKCPDQIKWNYEYIVSVITLRLQHSSFRKGNISCIQDNISNFLRHFSEAQINK